MARFVERGHASKTRSLRSIFGAEVQGQRGRSRRARGRTREGWPLPKLPERSNQESQVQLRFANLIPSMSRLANPYDNASCESFIKTLKREEIYANACKDLEHLRANIEEFIERYYKSAAIALGPGPPFSGRI